MGEASDAKRRRELARVLKGILRAKVVLPPQARPKKRAKPARRRRQRPVTAAASDPDGTIPVLDDDELERPIELPDPGAVPAVDGYELTDEIGRGGQGVVYRGTDRRTGRAVAVKVLPGGHFADPRARSRFNREVRILARLKCPNVVATVGHGRTADGSLFLVMPLVDGPPLDDYAAGLRGDDSAIARLFAAVADGVEFVHLAGVVHRDLKPANVRVTRRGVPVVLDFGLAGTSVAADKSRSLTRAGQLIGSLPWLAPEQTRGQPELVGPWSDVYAVGLMLCRAVADGGAPPYPVDGSFTDVVNRIRRARRRVAGRRAGDPMARVVLWCLAKRVADRYPTAAALADDLRRVAAGGDPLGPGPAAVAGT